MQGMMRVAVRSVMWKLIERFGAQGLNLLMQVILARLLVPKDFAVVAILLVFTYLASVIVQSGLGNALIQGKDVSKEDYSTVLWCSLALAGVLYVVLFLIADVVANFYRMPELSTPMRVLAAVLFFNALNSVQLAYVAKHFLFHLSTWATLAASCIAAVISISAAYLGFGLWSLVLQQLVNQCGACLILYMLIDWKPCLTFARHRARSLWAYGWKVFLSSFICGLTDNIFELVIGRILSPTTLGYVTQGRKYPAMLESIFGQSIQAVLFPLISRYQDSSDVVKNGTRQSTIISTFIITPVLALLAVACEPLVGLVLTEKWLPAVPYFQLFAIASMFTTPCVCWTNALYAIGRSDITLKLDLLQRSFLVCGVLLAAFVSGNALIISSVGILFGVFAVGTNSLACRKNIAYLFRDQMKDLVPTFFLTIAASIVAVICGELLESGYLLRLLIVTVAFLTTYVLLALVTNVAGYRVLKTIYSNIRSV